MSLHNKRVRSSIPIIPSFPWLASSLNLSGKLNPCPLSLIISLTLIFKITHINIYSFGQAIFFYIT